jgi:hypothetical protein
MTYKEIFRNINYPTLLDSIDDLNIYTLPPWDFIKEKFQEWCQDFKKNDLNNYFPFARMRNDDVIATFNESSDRIYLFNLPLTKSSQPFTVYKNINDWLKRVLNDMHEYLVDY